MLIRTFYLDFSEYLSEDWYRLEDGSTFFNALLINRQKVIATCLILLS